MQALIACAALLGYRFESRVLAACCGTTEADAVRALRRACELEILVADSPDGTQYRFRHALYRAAIRSTLNAGASAALHARIAATLETLGRSENRSEELAYHWERAGDEVRASFYRDRARDEVRRLGLEA